MNSPKRAEDDLNTVLLFGGSFNPPHDGHFAAITHLMQRLKTDEAWMLFSENPEKDPRDYPALHHRMAMARILARHYDPAIILSDAEAKIAAQIGRHDTYYILEELRRRHPDCKFIWVMGSDSFAKFHTWKERDDILQKYIVIVVGRPGYNDLARTSPTARDFAHAAFDWRRNQSLRYQIPGWSFVEIPETNISSTELVNLLQQRYQGFTGHFRDVANYAYAHNLYLKPLLSEKETSCPVQPTLPPYHLATMRIAAGP